MRVTGVNPSWFSLTGDGASRVGGLSTRSFPVERVSWEDAVEFCRKLSDLDEEKRSRRTYRLPTEAEWEYACRAGSGPENPFSFGRVLSSAQANFDGHHPYGGAAEGPHLARTAKVGSYPPNALGLYDMHGNVWEWCADWYGHGYYKESPSRDPSAPQNGKRRVVRGGSCYNSGGDCRAACRNSDAPNSRCLTFGLRVVCSIPTESPPAQS